MSKRFNTRTIVEAGMMIALTALLGRIILFRAPMGGKVTAGSMIPLLLIAMLRGPVVGVVVGAAYGIINFLIGGHSSVSILQWLLDYPIAFAALGLAGFFWLPRLRKFAEKGSGGEQRETTTLDLVLPLLVLALATVIIALGASGFLSGSASFTEAINDAPWVNSLVWGGGIALVFALGWQLVRKLSRGIFLLPVVGAIVGIGLRFLCHVLSGLWFFAHYAPEGVSPLRYSLSYNAYYMVPEVIISGFILAYLAPTVMKFLRQRSSQL